ncbi:MAG: hypothetical protein Q9162_003130, partial [Coniocarpon cinnabarinum]
ASTGASSPLFEPPSASFSKPKSSSSSPLVRYNLFPKCDPWPRPDFRGSVDGTYSGQQDVNDNHNGIDPVHRRAESDVVGVRPARPHMSSVSGTKPALSIKTKLKPSFLTIANSADTPDTFPQLRYVSTNTRASVTSFPAPPRDGGTGRGRGRCSFKTTLTDTSNASNTSLASGDGGIGQVEGGRDMSVSLPHASNHPKKTTRAKSVSQTASSAHRPSSAASSHPTTSSGTSHKARLLGSITSKSSPSTRSPSKSPAKSSSKSSSKSRSKSLAPTMCGTLPSASLSTIASSKVPNHPQPKNNHPSSKAPDQNSVPLVPLKPRSNTVKRKPIPISLRDTSLDRSRPSPPSTNDFITPRAPPATPTTPSTLPSDSDPTTPSTIVSSDATSLSSPPTSMSNGKGKGKLHVPERRSSLCYSNHGWSQNTSQGMNHHVVSQSVDRTVLGQSTSNCVANQSKDQSMNSHVASQEASRRLTSHQIPRQSLLQPVKSAWDWDSDDDENESGDMVRLVRVLGWGRGSVEKQRSKEKGTSAVASARASAGAMRNSEGEGMEGEQKRRRRWWGGMARKDETKRDGGGNYGRL